MQRPGFDGLLVIDKPSGITSRDVVDRVQRWFPLPTRIGHSGTLDPLATGVLVLCIGSATRLAEYIQRMPKVYTATINLGATSDTDDATGAITPTPNASIPSRDQVERALATFLGVIAQVPPDYSAAKVTGRRAYDLARKGHDVSLAPRSVSIHAIDLVDFSYPQLDIIVHCGKGTYIRSLSRDLGGQLGCGGYIASLRRSQIGSFLDTDAVTLAVEPRTARRHLLPLERAVVDLPWVTLEEPDAWRLVHGQRIPLPVPFESPEVAIVDDEGRLLAIAEVADGLLHATKTMVATNSK